MMGSCDARTLSSSQSTIVGGRSGEVKHAGEGGDAVAEWGRLLQVPRRERAGVGVGSGRKGVYEERRVGRAWARREERTTSLVVVEVPLVLVLLLLQ